MKRVVLLGTGTGVGKSHVGALVVQGWRGRGHPAWGLKPVESGVEPGAVDSDARKLRAGGPITQAGLHHRALRTPVSPHLAARVEHLPVDLLSIVGWVEQSETELVALHDNALHALSLIETAGGAFTPLSPTATCAHLALALAPARVVLVAADALGVLHDVTATLLALAALGCKVDSVVLSQSRPADASTGTNVDELEHVVFPALGAAAPIRSKAFHLPVGSSDVAALLDAWSSDHQSIVLPAERR